MSAENAENTAEIIPFAVPKTSSSGPKGHDWLRELPEGSFFLSKAKAGPPSQAAFFDRWGVANVIPEAILLAVPHRASYEFLWVDSAKFSELNRFVALLPTPDKPDIEAGEEDG